MNVLLHFLAPEVKEGGSLMKGGTIFFACPIREEEKEKKSFNIPLQGKKFPFASFAG